MDWVPEFVDGNVRASCSICGCSRRAPDNLTLCSDKRWRCTDRCMEVSEFEINKILAASRKRKPQPDAGFGLGPWDEVPPTFLAAAQARVAQLIPGWTPTTTFLDDFTIVPGGGGSSWTVNLTDDGSVSLISPGIARFSSGTSATGAARAYNATLSVPNPGIGNFYCAFTFRTAAISDLNSVISIGTSLTGVSSSSRNGIGIRGLPSVGAKYYQLVAQSINQAFFDSETDSSNFHTGEMWWRVGTPVFGSIDGGKYLTVQSAGAVSRTANIFINNTASTVVTPSLLDVSDYVCFV